MKKKVGMLRVGTFIILCFIVSLPRVDLFYSIVANSQVRVTAHIRLETETSD